MQTRAHLHQTVIELVQGDITRQATDAIVNAANSSLLGGGGVDGAVHRAAGPQLLEATRALGGCPTGEARITKGYNLSARYVIHAVGPIYHPNDPDAPRLLASAYRHSLQLAAANVIKTIAFPSISTGAYGYPVTEAAPIALAAVCDGVRNTGQFELVRFVLFDEVTLGAYANALKAQIKSDPDLREFTESN